MLFYLYSIDTLSLDDVFKPHIRPYIVYLPENFHNNLFSRGGSLVHQSAQ